MNIVVDTNIVFSAMWNTNSRIADILTNPHYPLTFHSPSYLLIELENHQEKLAERLQLNKSQFLELQHLVTRKIHFVFEGQISQPNWFLAEKLTRGVDMDDIAFVALALDLNCPLWTGDKRIAKEVSEIPIFDINQINELLKK